MPEVLIPTWRRTEQLRGTLHHVLACEPPPSGILVHVDAGDEDTPAMLEAEFADSVRWVVAAETRGPGGGRDVLARLAEAELLVSLDDDSWPVDRDFFHRVAELTQCYPDAAVLACNIFQKGAPPPSTEGRCFNLASFENCGCVIRRSAYLQTRGFLPLRYAYGMEEMDVAIQLLDMGWLIKAVPELKVFHDTELSHHPSPDLNAAYITNTALFAFLRYPAFLWPLGIVQVANRIRYALRMRRFAGITQGIIAIPATCWKHRSERQPLRTKTILSARHLARAKRV